MSKTQSSSDEPILELDAVTKQFGGLVAVDGVDLTIDRGELVGLIGPNGSGKSTLFKLIFGVHDLSDGTITFNGEPITSDMPVHEIAKRGIAQFYQESTLMLDMSVRDNIRLSTVSDSLLSVHGSREHDDRIEAVLEQTKLLDVANESAEDLTHKNKQKLELAKAVVRDPDLLLLDEPFAGLTREEADEIIEIIRDLSDSGMTICTVDHNLRWLRSFVNRIVVLHNGNVIADGPPEQVVENEAVKTAYIGEHGAEDQ